MNPFSKHALSARISVLAIGLISVLFIGDARASIKIEQVQREYQARYYFLTGAYVAWPGCPCGMPAPAFPPDGFYGDLDKNKSLALDLVRDLAQKFYVPSGGTYGGIFDRFLRTPDGVANVEGVSAETNLEYYLLSDVPPSVGGAFMPYAQTILTNNYLECFMALKSYIEKLNWIDCNASETNVANCIVQGYSLTNCQVAKDQASSFWQWGENPDKTDGVFSQWTKCQRGTNRNNDVEFTADARALRGRLFAPVRNQYPHLETGMLLVYLSVSTGSAGLGNTFPPTTANNLRHKVDGPIAISKCVF